ncbi:MAG TPA: hypothetical protein VH721_06615 [Gaiellaceae bacterium]|jgi:hypothetical protein
MTDLDKMLEEGPRVAPEPRMAEADVAGGATEAPALPPSEEEEKQDGVEEAPLRSSDWPRRLLPLAIVAVFFAANTWGLWSYTEILFVALAAGSVLFALVRRARR